jgi:uncharacterized membrane protein
MIIYFCIFVLIYSVIEFIYLTITHKFYKTHLAKIQNINNENVKIQMFPYGILTYIILFITIWYFIIHDIFNGNNLKIKNIITKATLFALAIYGVYNLTNAATINKYNIRVIIQDILWGIIAINTVSIICYWIKIKFI